jgi:hypothetical protein
MQSAAQHQFHSNGLPSLDLHFALRVRGAVPDLPFLGPTVRGLLGYGLRQTCCGHEPTESGSCSHGDNCTYAFLFEGPLQRRDAFRRLTLDALPQPFLPLVEAPKFALTPSTVSRRAETTSKSIHSDPQLIRFGIRLIGTARGLASSVIDAIAARQSYGFGARSQSYTLESVTQSCPTARVPCSAAQPRTTQSQSTIRLRCLTPIAFDRPLEDKQLLGSTIIDAAAKRLWLLEMAYGVGCPQRSIPRAVNPTEFTTRASSLQPWSFTRRSTRHGRVIQLSGQLGEAAIEGPWCRYALLLSAIDHFGVGRNISFGFGRVQYEFVPATSPVHTAINGVSKPHSTAHMARVPRWIRLRGAPPSDRVPMTPLRESGPQ